MKKLFFILLSLVISSMLFGAIPSRFNNGLESQFLRPYMNTGNLIITATVINVTTLNAAVQTSTGLFSGTDINLSGTLTANKLVAGSGEFGGVYGTWKGSYHYLQSYQDGINNQVRLGCFGGSGIQNYLAFDRSQGTFATSTPLLVNDKIGAIVGVVAKDYTNVAVHSPMIQMAAEEAYTTTSVGSRIEFITVKNGTLTQNIMMVVGNSFVSINSGLIASGVTANGIVNRGYYSYGATTAGSPLDISSNVSQTYQMRLKAGTGSASSYIGNWANSTVVAQNNHFNGSWSQDDNTVSGSVVTLENGDIFFSSIPAGTASPTGYEKMRINSAGNVGIGLAAPSTKLEEAGISSMNSLVLSGGVVTPSATAGAVWFRTDTKKLKCYDGTTWQDLF